MVEITSRAGQLALVGGQLCLDFTNTVGAHRSDQGIEYLTSYADLVAWSRHTGTVTAAEAEQLLAVAWTRPAEAAAVLARAIVLREALYRLVSGMAGGQPPDDSALATLNAALAPLLGQSRLLLGEAEAGFVWAWAGAPDALDQLLWPVAWSAGELLTSGELARVRECAGDTCGWLFMDLSRNRSRRWCDMQDCGNRAKARRHYQRRRVARRVDVRDESRLVD